MVSVLAILGRCYFYHILGFSSLFCLIKQLFHLRMLDMRRLYPTRWLSNISCLTIFGDPGAASRGDTITLGDTMVFDESLLQISAQNCSPSPKNYRIVETSCLLASDDDILRALVK